MKNSNAINIFVTKNPITIKIMMLVLLLAVIFLVYWQAIDHDFLSYDDEVYVTDNAHVKEGITNRSIVWAFSSLENSNWHPVTWLSHMLDYELYGLNPKGHHFTNILFHAANSIFLFLLFYYATNKYWNSLFLAALFALHPLHVESVAWVAERKDLISTLFGILTLFVYSRYVRHPTKVKYIFALFLYALGLMSKPMLVTLPFVMLLWDLWPLGRFKIAKVSDESGHGSLTPLRLIFEKIPFFLLSLSSCVITYYAQYKGGSISSVKATPIALRLVNAVVSYFRYIVKMLWPHDLAIIYPLPQTMPAVHGVIAGLLILGVSFLLYRAARHYPYLFVGWLWYVGTLVPVIGLVQVGSQSMADRYSYVPLIGLFIMTSWGVPALIKDNHRRRLILALSAGLVLLALTVCTWIQISYWQNSVTLFSHAVKAIADNNAAYRILGNNFAKQGNIDVAVQCFREAVRINPDDEIARTDLGVALLDQGKTDEAAYHLAKALKINPDHANAHYNLGLLLAQKGRLEEAISHYKETLRIDPGRGDAHANLGAVFLREERIQEAIFHLNEALRMDPDNATIRHYLGLALAKEKKAQ